MAYLPYAPQAPFNPFSLFPPQETPKPAATTTTTGGQTFTAPATPATFTTPTAGGVASDINTYYANTLNQYPGIEDIKNRMVTGQLGPIELAKLQQHAAEYGTSTGSPAGGASAAAFQKALNEGESAVRAQATNQYNAAKAGIPALNPLGISGQALTAYGDTLGALTSENIAAGNAASRFQDMQYAANQQNQRLAAERAMFEYQQRLQQQANAAYAKAIQDLINRQTGVTVPGGPAGPATGAQTETYSPGYDYAAGVYTSPWADTGQVEGPAQGSGEGGAYVPSGPFDPSELYWPEG